MRILFIMLVALFVSACSSVTMRTDGEAESSAAPSFQQSYTYWWWGLKGEHTINTREICTNQPVMQMQSTYTLSDAFAGLFTLGIYSPRSARVWCGEINE